MRPEMTARERLTNAIEGRPVDRLPWAPFLAYFWEAQPPELTSRGVDGQLDFLREVGADPLWRGDAWGAPCPTRRRRPDVTVRSFEKDGRTLTETETPVGTLRSVSRASAVADTTFLIEHPLKTKQDFEVQLWIEEHTRTEWADQEPVRQAVTREGLALGMLVPEGRSAWARCIQNLAGTPNLIYALADFPDTVHALLGAMVENDVAAVRMAAESAYDYFLAWENTSSQNYSPAMFDAYNAPELRRWCSILAGSGKSLIHHACGHLHHLLAPIKACGVKAIESLASPPTGNISLTDARAIAGSDMAIIGGIEPVHFLELELEELRTYVLGAIEDGAGGPFVLANSDSCPPGVDVAKFKLVGEIVRQVHPPAIA